MLAWPALAHDGGVGISLSAERLPPGGALEIIGTNLAPGETLQIKLIGPVREWVLPSVTTGLDGNFAVVLSVPNEATAGLFTLDAISSSGIIQRATFQVDSAARAPALTPSPVQPASSQEMVDLGGSAWAMVPLAVLVLVAVTFVALAIRRRPHASSAH